MHPWRYNSSFFFKLNHSPSDLHNISLVSKTEKILRKASFQLVDTHIHSLQKKLSSLDEQLHVLKKQLNQLCNPLTCPYIKGIVLNLNTQLHNHVRSTKNEKLSNLRTSQCCCSVDSVTGKPSHQNQSVTNCHAALAVDLSLIHIWRCRRTPRCRSRWSPYH